MGPVLSPLSYTGVGGAVRRVRVELDHDLLIGQVPPTRWTAARERRERDSNPRRCYPHAASNGATETRPESPPGGDGRIWCSSTLGRARARNPVPITSSPGWPRTNNLALNRGLLRRLSYEGMAAPTGLEPATCPA